MKYKIILADPPWQYNDKSKNRGGAEKHYPTMSPDELRRLNVGRLADKDSALCMWVTMPHIPTALTLLNHWGFEFVTTLFVWVKTYSDGDPRKPFVGMGHHTRSNAEIMILARPKGGKSPKRVDASIRQVQYFPVTRHSEKPKEFHDLITKLYGDLPRAELFARDKAPGWDVWGNEVDSDIKLGPSNFKSVGEAYRHAIKEQEVGNTDYRIICPKCYEIGDATGGKVDDGGGIFFDCLRCDYEKSTSDILLIPNSLKVIYREANRA